MTRHPARPAWPGGRRGLIVLDQIRTLDRARLVRRLGALRPTTLAATLQVMQAMFAR